MIKLCLIFINMADYINGFIGKLLSICPLALTVLSATEVTMRYVFKSPTIWIWDLNVQIFALFVTLAGGYALLHRSHIAVDFLTQKISVRAKAFIDILTSPIFFFAMFVLMYFGGIIAWESWEGRESMSTLWGPPMYTLKAMIPISAFLITIQGVAKLFRDLTIVIKGEGALPNE